MITIETIRADLQTARNTGKMNEVTDLSLILEHRLHRPMQETDAYLKALRAALNRYNQRRFRKGLSDKRAPNAYRVGDRVMVPNDEVWIITKVEPEWVWQGTYSCHVSQLRPVGSVAAPDDVAAPVASTAQHDARQAACDALYHAVADALDNGLLGAWPGASAALDAYEKALDGL